MNDEILYNAYINWRCGLDRFYWFLSSTPFASIDDISEYKLTEAVKPKSESLEIFNKNETQLLKAISDKSLIIVDLNGEEALDLALMLNNKLSVKPVIVFAQIYHPRGIVGNEVILSKLIEYSFKLKSSTKDVYSFIFDYSRYGKENFDKKSFFNNQYELTEEELPLKDDFLNNGIKSVMILTYKDIKEDIKDYIGYLKECNIQVDVITV